MYRLGVVSFLNSRPLIERLEGDRRIELRFDVPARLPALLEAGEVDAALVPVVDILRSRGRHQIISDACIGCDGETMTVRVFSQTPPDRLRRLWVDADSHTSVALASVLWRKLYGRSLELRPLEGGSQAGGAESEGVLLIGDKVVDPARGQFAYEVDLGGAWRQCTGLPFVFAAWAVLAEGGKQGAGEGGGELGEILSGARDRGVAAAGEIAERWGPKLGWPAGLARRYLTRCLKFSLDRRAIAGADLFARYCAEVGLVPREARVGWPAALRAEVPA